MSKSDPSGGGAGVPPAGKRQEGKKQAGTQQAGEKSVVARGTLAGPGVSGRLVPVARKVPGKAVVVLAVPSYGNSYCGEFVRSLMQLTHWAATRGVKLKLMQFNYADIAATRNILASKFLFEHPGATHMLFVDDDMGFDPALVADALALEVDMVGAFYPKRSIDLRALHAAAAQPFDTALARGMEFIGAASRVAQRRGRFISADYIGTGFMLIRRTGLERLIAGDPALRAAERYLPVLPQWSHPYFITAFDRLTVKGRELPEDYAFCKRWRRAGLEIWAAEDAGITHTGEQIFRARYTDR